MSSNGISIFDLMEIGIVDKFMVLADAILSFIGEERDLEIPLFIEEQLMKIIGMGAFMGNSTVEQITVPEGIEKIGDLAFAEMENLRRVVIPTSVKTIGADPFGLLYREMSRDRDCPVNRKLEEVVIHRALTRADYEKLKSCSISLPNGQYMLMRLDRNVPIYDFLNNAFPKYAWDGGRAVGMADWTAFDNPTFVWDRNLKYDAAGLVIVSGECVAKSEKELVKELIDNYDDDREWKEDEYFCTSSERWAKTIVFTFSEMEKQDITEVGQQEQTGESAEDEIGIILRAQIQPLFCQKIYRVNENDKIYYRYKRMFLQQVVDDWGEGESDEYEWDYHGCEEMVLDEKGELISSYKDV